jgi:hypothetical protein
MTFDGMLGMSNIDESSGDLLMSQLWSSPNKVLKKFVFSILMPTKEEVEVGSLSLGDHNLENVMPGYELVSHRVSGSFHWTIHLVRFRIGLDDWLIPRGR